MGIILDFSFEFKHILHIDLDCMHYLVEREDVDTMRALMNALVSLKAPLPLSTAEKFEMCVQDILNSKNFAETKEN